jgi:hypothetical protein
MINFFFSDMISDFAKFIPPKELTYSKLHRSTIECKEGLCISRLVRFELLFELKIEQKTGTSLDSPRCKNASRIKPVERLSVPVI